MINKLKKFESYINCPNFLKDWTFGMTFGVSNKSTVSIRTDNNRNPHDRKDDIFRPVSDKITFKELSEEIQKQRCFSHDVIHTEYSTISDRTWNDNTIDYLYVIHDYPVTLINTILELRRDGSISKMVNMPYRPKCPDLLNFMANSNIKVTLLDDIL